MPSNVGSPSCFDLGGPDVVGSVSFSIPFIAASTSSPALAL